MTVNSIVAPVPIENTSTSPPASPGFAAAVEAERMLTGRGDADFVSGQIGVNLKQGRPTAVVFFDQAGRKLTQTTFDAKSILKTADRLGIPLADLNGLADQLDEAKISYKPYSLLAGTGSDHGIDLRDLASGGLGTAYDWRTDVNVSAKGKFAPHRLAEAQALADRLGLKANAEVTTGGGLALGSLTPQVDGQGILRGYAVSNGGWAAWYRTEAEARAAASATKAFLLSLQLDKG